MSSLIGFKKVARAFINGDAKRLKNDDTDGTQLRFHGNVIAVRNPTTGFIDVTLAGWNTVTTRARINALSDLLGTSTRVFQRNFNPYIFDWRNREAGEF